MFNWQYVESLEGIWTVVSPYVENCVQILTSQRTIKALPLPFGGDIWAGRACRYDHCKWTMNSIFGKFWKSLELVKPCCISLSKWGKDYIQRLEKKNKIALPAYWNSTLNGSNSLESTHSSFICNFQLKKAFETAGEGGKQDRVPSLNQQKSTELSFWVSAAKKNQVEILLG